MEIMITEIILIIFQIIWIVFLALILKEVRNLVRETLIILKSKDVYEAKAVLEKEEEEEKGFEKEVPLEDLEPEKAAELLKRELQQ